MGLEPEGPGTIPFLFRQGFTKFRKSNWTLGAFLELHVVQGFGGPGYGPWLTLHDPVGYGVLESLGMRKSGEVPNKIIVFEAGVSETDWEGVPDAVG